jgi:predicted DNA-binding transcriptional regulator AlpA
VTASRQFEKPALCGLLAFTAGILRNGKEMQNEIKEASVTVQQFDSLPNSAAIDIPDASAVSGRSRASIYRHFEAGELTKIKVGNSTRVRVGELRKLIGVSI